MTSDRKLKASIGLEMKDLRDLEDLTIHDVNDLPTHPPSARGVHALCENEIERERESERGGMRRWGVSRVV